MRILSCRIRHRLVPIVTIELVLRCASDFRAHVHPGDAVAVGGWVCRMYFHLFEIVVGSVLGYWRLTVIYGGYLHGRIAHFCGILERRIQGVRTWIGKLTFRKGVHLPLGGWESLLLFADFLVTSPASHQIEGCSMSLISIFLMIIFPIKRWESICVAVTDHVTRSFSAGETLLFRDGPEMLRDGVVRAGVLGLVWDYYRMFWGKAAAAVAVLFENWLP